MRRSIQIASACAFLMAAAGPVTGLSDGLAAEGEKLPCNNFCRTWMGYEAGEGSTPQAAPAETVTVKPSEGLRDPEAPVEDPAAKIVRPKGEAKTDGAEKPSHPKTKRKKESDTADVSDHRPLAKTNKLAKRPKLDDDSVSDGRSSSEPASGRQRLKVEGNVRAPSRDHNAAASQTTAVIARDVPLPPRLPRAARPSRTGVAQVGPNAIEEMRASAIDGQPAASKPVRTGRSAPNPDAAQADVPPPTTRSVAAAGTRTTSKTVDIVPMGVSRDSAAASPPSLADTSITPVAPRKDAARGTPQSEKPQPALPARSEAATTEPPRTAVTGPAVAVATPAAPVVAPPSVSDNQAARVAPKAPPPAAAVAGESPARNPPDAIGARPAVASTGPAAAVSSPAAGKAIAPASDPLQEAARVAPKAEVPPTAAVAVPGEAPGEKPAHAIGTGPAVAGSMDAVASSALGDAVAPATDPRQDAARIPTPAVTNAGGIAANNPPSKLPQDQTVVDGVAAAAPSPARGQAVIPLSAPDKEAAKVTSHFVAPPPTVVVSDEAAPKSPPALPGKDPAMTVDDTASVAPLSHQDSVGPPASGYNQQGARVAPQAEAPPPAVAVPDEASANNPPTTLGSGSAVIVGDLTEPETASSGVAARPNSIDGSGHRAAASSDVPTPAVTDQAVPVPGRAPVHNDNASVTALNEPGAALSDLVPHVEQSPLVLPGVNGASTPGNGSAQLAGPAPSSPNWTNAGNEYGALKKIDNTNRAPPGETASIVMAPPPGTLPADENPATLVKIAIGDVSAQPEGTTIAYTITNPATGPVDLLFVRCNAVDPKGTVVGSAFDYVENIPAGQQVRRVVRMSSEVTSSGQTFSCANDAATQ